MGANSSNDHEHQLQVVGSAYNDIHHHQQYSQQQHSMIIRYKCSYCGRGFSNAQALGGHMNVHRRDRGTKFINNNNVSSSDHISPHHQSQLLPWISPHPYMGLLGISMDEMTSYYPPPHPPPSGNHNSHYPYYPPPYPPPQPSHGGGPSMATHWYHQPQQQQQQQPPFSSYSHGFPPQTTPDDVRTLFIAGFPEDIKAREIYNLFREFPGYQSSQLRNASRNNQAFGFAVFADQHSAVAALQAVNGLVFDLEKNSTLYVDLAKSNSRSKRSRTDDERSGFADKKARGPAAFSRGAPDSGVGSNIHMPGMGNSAYNMNGYPSTQSHRFDDGAINDADSRRLNSAGPYSPQCASPPCPTLFVANLGPTCSEQELNQVFSRCPGFLKLKMQNKNGAPVAFVDFQDIACSTAALNSLQNTVLYSSVGEGMRLEFAKSRMGMRKKT